MMIGADQLTGEASIIVQLNRQDALQKAQVQTTTDAAQEPSRTQNLYGKDNSGEVKTTQRVNEISDQEPDSDADDRGSVTETRGQNVNIVA